MLVPPVLFPAVISSSWRKENDNGSEKSEGLLILPKRDIPYLVDGVGVLLLLAAVGG